ncbi:tyrosine-type recombinase/integrase [Shewanella surugensis]|uniref:Site-specific integrase n=1 Tax=Shewanella surugensis TaxID=212020 RepID=A0ABT0L954_9GAMM|nr:site-specific integrase [Shewanella surugensis]MCL1124198.1 site-specific integrase [Shewanella surugensis]
MSLTDSKLRNIKSPYNGPREVADRDGLTARITKNAMITFNYRFRWHGKQQRIKIGRYPDMKLSLARIKTGELRQALQDGLDPRCYAVQQSGGRLLGDICNDFMDIYAIKELSSKSVILYKSFINKYIMPNYNIDVERYRYTEWVKFLDTVRTNTSAANAGSILKRLKTVIRWSKSRGEIKDSFCLDIPIKAIGTTQSQRDRVLEWSEVAGLWRQIESSRATPKTKACVQLLILTGARNAEIREAKRAEFKLDDAVWVLPKERSKTGKAIRRPLSDHSIHILELLDFIYGVERQYLIEGAQRDKCLTTHSINRYVQRLNEVLKYEHFVPHDFRRTISTRLSEKRVMPHVTEKMLGHELGGIMAIYNKHDWIDEQKAAYQLYWNELKTHVFQ